MYVPKTLTLSNIGPLAWNRTPFIVESESKHFEQPLPKW